MDTYSVISDNSNVPELTDLELLSLDQPTGGRLSVRGLLRRAQLQQAPGNEQAVGQRCRVLRTARWSDPGVRWRG
jgi:hypothetical protein